MSEDTEELIYLVDDETSEMLEAALNIVAGVAELQYDDHAKAGLQSIAEILAQRFNIPVAYLNISIDEDGEVTTTVEEPSSNIAETFPEDPEGTVH